MYIQALIVRNFRRLQNVKIELASDISIFVGANNSGKTSAAHALQLFMAASRERFSVHDFSAECWLSIDGFGERKEGSVLPTISMDIWFSVRAEDLHLVIDLLPSLAWTGTLVGIRVEFSASNEAELLAHFTEAREKARANIRQDESGAADYVPSPRTLREFLEDNLKREFELRYYVLDRAQFDDELLERPDYKPLLLSPDKGRTGRDILASLLKVDFLQAQRHLSDSAGGNRSEDLSRCLSRYYDRNLEKLGEDFDTLYALAEAEAMLNEHLDKVFGPTLTSLATLGYPGLNNPQLLIKSALKPAAIMASNEGAKVHYALGDAEGDEDPPTLPDRYNGLGFKNLIYIVIELLDLHQQWLNSEESRPPLHLIFIEEPEAHLHTQLQQVFIRQILGILRSETGDQAHFKSQLVVTTHSPHILYERGFRPICYFRRSEKQSSDVLNLSNFYDHTATSDRDFLERYLKLTHCDLFFADAAVLVEGNVERLLLPQMIEKAAPRLKSACLSILEIGGAFGHRFKSLIEFLGITALIVTDIDSVIGPEEAAADGVAQPEAEEEGAEERSGSVCMVEVEGAVTSNQTLIQWLPGLTQVEDLLNATPEQKIKTRAQAGNALVRATYQTEVAATWGAQTKMLTGRTLEEAFALENLTWCQDDARKDLGLRIRGGAGLDLDQMAQRLHKKINGSGFNKTDFALALLAQDPAAWNVPLYIVEGLTWLEQEVTPPPVVVEPQAAAALVEAAA